MPSAAFRHSFEDQIQASYLSIFHLDAETMADRDIVTLVDPNLVGLPSKPPPLANRPPTASLAPDALPPDASRHRYDNSSILTPLPESADSSPTTTLSTSDSSPLSDPSPSSSPDSPPGLIPPSSYPSSSSFASAHPHHAALFTMPSPLSLERPLTSPNSRRTRNTKGLSIQPPTATTSLPKPLVTEPCSPSFIRPRIPAMRRKPSQLSLRTSTSDLMIKASLQPPPSPSIMPPPMLHRRALKHSTSSPHMLSALPSSTFGPVNGMAFPTVLERNQSGLSEVLRPTRPKARTRHELVIAEEESPIKPQMAHRLDSYQPSSVSGENEDQKTPGYPDGPIAIYGDNVFLYSEPTLEQACRFDVVINVAREVDSPFSNRPDARSPICPELNTSTPFDEAINDDRPADDRSAETPTTPKANPLKRPEYIHIPWDHNTDITPDLMRLCETIESRTSQGKKVLIHCQQGASRSASLIIAYGLYQGPEMSVNDAYYAAQAKSRWISPNMKLMYSLQDFRKELSKTRLSALTTLAHRPRPGRSPKPPKHRSALSADAIDVRSREPQSAPLPSVAFLPGQDPQTLAGAAATATAPGPASAPLVCPWSESGERQRASTSIASLMKPGQPPQPPPSKAEITKWACPGLDPNPAASRKPAAVGCSPAPGLRLRDETASTPMESALPPSSSFRARAATCGLLASPKSDSRRPSSHPGTASLRFPPEERMTTTGGQWEKSNGTEA